VQPLSLLDMLIKNKFSESALRVIQRHDVVIAIIQEWSQVAEFLTLLVELYTQNPEKHHKFLPFLELYEAKLMRQDSEAYTNCLQQFLQRVVKCKTQAKVLSFAMSKNTRALV